MTGFYNYGGAWYQGREFQPIEAQGYNVDLLFENKNVHFNAGFGMGQVIGNRFEAYLKLGFDALF